MLLLWIKDLLSINDHEFKDGNGAIVQIENLVDQVLTLLENQILYSVFVETILRFLLLLEIKLILMYYAKRLVQKSYLVDSSIKNYLDEDIADFKFDTFSRVYLL